MKISAVDQDISTILQAYFYSIPRFQRPYSWEVDVVDEFWDDIIRDPENLDYFIGSMVLYGKSPTFGIVDGQQRLTTITVLLAAIRNAFVALGNHGLAKSVQSLIERDDLNAGTRFVIETESSYPYFHDHIQRLNDPVTRAAAKPEEIALKEAFDLLSKRVYAYADFEENSLLTSEQVEYAELRLKELVSRVRSLKIIFIVIDNEQDAYSVFETLNTRGKELVATDLIKIHLLRSLRPEDGRLDTSRATWDKIRKTIESIRVQKVDTDSFLHHQWLSAYAYVPSRRLYRSVRREIPPGKALEFLTMLESDSELYKVLFHPSSRSWQREEGRIPESLDATQNIFNVRQAIPFLLSILRAYQNRKMSFKRTLEALQLVENFHFQYTAVAGLRGSGGIAGMYSKSGRQIYEASSSSERTQIVLDLRSKLFDKAPVQAEFAIKFVENVGYSKRHPRNKVLTEYILWKMACHMNPHQSFDRDGMSIEHLMPQSRASSDADSISVSSIGNLILVPTRLNNELLANHPFSRKRDILVRHGIHLDPVLMGSEEWNADQIRERANWLADKARGSVWNLIGSGSRDAQSQLDCLTDA